MSNNLENINLFVFDVDGTLILGEKPLKDAKTVLSLLNKKKKDFIILSNNSSYSTSQNLERLTKILEFKLSLKNIYTSILATIDFLKAKKFTKCYIVGTPSMEEELAENGITNTEHSPQAIVLGFDKTLTYDKIEKTALFLQKQPEIPFIATHPDDTCPMDYGSIPDVGSFLKMFEQATTRSADWIAGKPNTEILTFILIKKDIPASEVLVIGDRLKTDISMGKEVGTKTALVLTGDTKRKDLERITSDIDYIWEDLTELKEILETL